MTNWLDTWRRIHKSLTDRVAAWEAQKDLAASTDFPIRAAAA
jgi:hypothetical protein